jgi:hypothetical protein
MKKFIAGTFLFFGLQSALFGQGAAVELGPKVKGMKRTSAVEIIGKDEEAIYVNQMYFSFLSLKFVRESYNLNMEKTNSVQIDLKKTNNRVVKKLFGTILLKDKMFSLFSNTDLNNKINTLEIDEIDKSTLLPEGNEKTLAEISFEEGNKRNTGGFGYSQSHDSSKVLVYYYMPYEKGQPQKFGMHVYNDEFEEIWKKEIELPYDDDLFDIVSYCVGNDGNVYVLGKVYEEKHRDKKRGEVNYKYHVFYYTNNENDTYDVPIDSKSKFFNEISMSLNNNNQVICVGLYSTSLGGVSEGTFYLRIDSKTHKVLADTQKEFSELMDDNNNYSERKRKRKQDRVYRNYEFRQIIQKEDGGIIVVAEQYYVVVVTTTTKSSTGGTTTKTTYYYHYDNILVLNIDKNGKFLWQKIIPKNQVSADDGGYYSSFTLAVKDDNLYFLYNTSKKKFFLFRDPKDLLSLFVLDKEGELSEKSDIIDKKDSKVYMVPKTGVHIADNEIYMFGRGRRTNRFAKITID